MFLHCKNCSYLIEKRKLLPGESLVRKCPKCGQIQEFRAKIKIVSTITKINLTIKE